MEYRLKNSPFKITADNKEDAARMFREMAPGFANTSADNIQEVKRKNKTIRAVRIPKSKTTPAIVAELRVAAWDYSQDGVCYAVICSPNHNQFAVEMETGLIFRLSEKPLPKRKEINAMIEKRKQQLEHVREVSTADFWQTKL